MSNSDMFRFYLVKNIRMETVSKNGFDELPEISCFAQLRDC